MPKLKQLHPYHKKALELKYKGNVYKDIAEALGEFKKKSRKSKRGTAFTEQTIKDWFKEGGTLNETYRIYEQEMDAIHRQTMDAIKKAGVRVREENFRLANEMLVALMGSENDGVKLGAIRELLNRVEGQPKEIIDLNPRVLGEMKPMERWELIPYEMRLRLSMSQYPEEVQNRVEEWVNEGK